MAGSIIDEIDTAMSGNAKIMVIGLGGGGGNAINEMINQGLYGVQFISANTDLQVLSENRAPIKVQLGEKLTRGLGAGSNPEVGKNAANESLEAINAAISGADMLFITAGMGGGTGTGAAPVVAQAAHDADILTVGVVTKPFSFERKKRMDSAIKGIEELKKYVDCLIVIPNDRLVTLAPKKAPAKQMFQLCNQILLNAVQGISDVIQRPGLINLDFADVKNTMLATGLALMGTGRSSGENRAREAAMAAISSPLLEDVSLETAKSILYNITATDEITMDEITEISNIITEATLNEDIDIKFGCVTDNDMGDELQVTVIATGIDPKSDIEEVVAPMAGKVVNFTSKATPDLDQQPVPQARKAPMYSPETVETPVNPRVARTPADRWANGLPRSPYGRRQEIMGKPGRQYAPGSTSLTYDEDDFDIPTFMRTNGN